MKNVLVFVGLMMVISACSKKEDVLPYTFPNIVWIVAEDLSPVIPSFGDSTILTPNLSRLASEGICYDRFFSPSGVCSPSRAAIATGMYPIEIGANHMRTGPWFPGIPQEFIDSYAERAMPQGILPYEAVPPPGVKMMSEYLRGTGYYCTNNSKEDYQFVKSVVAWDESSNKAHWRNKSGNQPFFSVFNIGVTHESQIWAKANDSLWVDDNLDVPIPPYLPRTDSSIMDVRRMYSNIKEMDTRVGQILKELADDRLLDNTIIFWYTDHGGPLPRQKRLTYDSGLKVPMIIRFPDKRNAGNRDDQMLSFIDLAPTVLSLANLEPQEIISGRAFLGPYMASTEREYIHAASDRFDETAPDPIRAVRDTRYKYIRYFDQSKPMFYHVGYRNQMAIMRELYKLRDEGMLNKEQALWFRETKPREEFFDTLLDPHELNDLSKKEEYSEDKKRLSQELDRWLSSIDDLNMMPEKDLIEKFWPEGFKPTTAAPMIYKKNDMVTISSQTKGSSIGYRVLNDVDTGDIWNIYTGPVSIDDGDRVVAVAHKLGFHPSSHTTE